MNSRAIAPARTISASAARPICRLFDMERLREKASSPRIDHEDHGEHGDDPTGRNKAIQSFHRVLRGLCGEFVAAATTLGRLDLWALVLIDRIQIDPETQAELAGA